MNQTKVQEKEKGFKKCCKICNIWIDNSSMEQHLKGKKHLSVVNQMSKKKRMEAQVNNAGIFITGIPPNMNNEILVKHFKTFGQVVAIQRYEKETQGLLQFGNRKQAQSALSHICHQVEGISLTITPRSKTAGNYTNNSVLADPSVQMEAFKKELKDFLVSNHGISIEEQFRSITTILQVTEEERHQQFQIISSLEQWLSIEFPSCRLHAFGSSVSGLGFHKESDLDMYLETPSTIDTLILESTETEEELAAKLRENAIKILRRASNIIRTHPDISGMLVICNARIPVAKFVHIPTGINCDLTCNNIIGVQNSKLLYSLQCFDERIRPFLYVLKFWAKCRRIVGSAESTLSSYALNLLAVYYLQQIQPPILPSIETLQNEVPDDERMYCNGWNVNFKIPFVHRNPQTETDSKFNITNLLIGFFSFYRKLNAEEVIICPLVGKLLPKAEFCDSFHVLQDKSKFAGLNRCGRRSPFKMSTLSVQDPFELNFNVTFSFRDYELFQLLCESAERVCLDFGGVEKNSNLSLLSLFNKPLKTRIPLKVLKPRDEPSVLVLTFKSVNVAMLNDNRKLCHSVGQFIGNLFNFGYGIVVNESTEVQCKQPKIEFDNSDEDFNDLLFKWRGNYTLNVPFNVCHEKRDGLSEEVCIGKTTKSLLDHQRAITSLLSNQYGELVCMPKNTLTTKDGFKPFAVLDFSMNCDVNVPSLSLHFKNTNVPNSVFQELVTGFRRCVSKAVQTFLAVNEFLYEVS